MNHVSYIFLCVLCKNSFHFILSCICLSDFFSQSIMNDLWLSTPHPTRLHKEQRKTSDWAKLKTTTNIFKKSRFCCGFSQTTVFYSPKVLPHSKMHPISARIPLISFLCCRHSTINFTFGPQWSPGMSNCPDSSLSPPMWTLQLDCINGLISLVNDWTKTLMGVISTRLVISLMIGQ